MLKHLQEIRPLMLVAIPIILIDQAIKLIIQNTIELYHEQVIIPGVLRIGHYTNTGAAFGLMKGRNWLFVFIISIAIGFIILYYRHFRYNLWMKLSLGFLLGGAFGNLIDRIRVQHVIDFVSFRWWLIHFRWWPWFNVADAAVCIGAAMLLVHILRERGEHEKLPDT